MEALGEQKFGISVVNGTGSDKSYCCLTMFYYFLNDLNIVRVSHTDINDQNQI